MSTLYCDALAGRKRIYMLQNTRAESLAVWRVGFERCFHSMPQVIAHNTHSTFHLNIYSHAISQASVSRVLVGTAPRIPNSTARACAFSNT